MHTRTHTHTHTHTYAHTHTSFAATHLLNGLRDSAGIDLHMQQKYSIDLRFNAAISLNSPKLQ